MGKALLELSSFLRRCPTCPVQYCDGFIEYTYKFVNKIVIFLKLFDLKIMFFSPKQGLARIKAFL